MKKLAGLYTAALLLAIVPTLFAQYRDIPKASGGDEGLRAIAPGFTIDQLPGEERDAWASSYLPAEGKPPVTPDFSTDITALDDETNSISDATEERETYNAWARMYGAGSASDGRNDTAWVEGAQGNGEGEVLIVDADPVRALTIHAGFQKSKDLYLKNARPRKVRVWVLEAVNTHRPLRSKYITTV